MILHGENEDDSSGATEAELRMRARNQFKLSVIFLANRLLLNGLSLRRQATA
jgi:hypothetical protein